MKLLISLVALGLVPALCSAARGSAPSTGCSPTGYDSDFNFGRKGPNDWPLYLESVTLSPSEEDGRSIDLRYPREGLNPAGTIHAIEVKDIGFRTGTNGCVSIKDGGVGQDHVTLTITSQKDHGVYFYVTIYGH